MKKKPYLKIEHEETKKIWVDNLAYEEIPESTRYQFKDLYDFVFKNKILFSRIQNCNCFDNDPDFFSFKDCDKHGSIRF